MTRTCTVCRSERLGDVDRDIVRGVPLRDIAKRYGLTTSSVARHKAAHPLAMRGDVVEAVVVAQAERDRVAELKREADALLRKARSLLSTAEDAGAVSVALSALRESGRLVEMLLRAEGAFADGGVNVAVAVGDAPPSLPPAPEGAWTRAGRIVDEETARFPSVADKARAAFADALGGELSYWPEMRRRIVERLTALDENIAKRREETWA